MPSRNRLLCFLALTAALLGALGTAPCGDTVPDPAHAWTLTEPCRPAAAAGDAENAGGGCPCDPAPALPTLLPPPPAARVARLGAAGTLAPRSPRLAPGRPVPIA